MILGLKELEYFCFFLRTSFHFMINFFLDIFKNDPVIVLKELQFVDWLIYWITSLPYWRLSFNQNIVQIFIGKLGHLKLSVGIHRSFITKFMNRPLRPSGKEDIYAVVDKYLDYVIHYDQPFVATKYNIQQHIGGDQVSNNEIIILLVFCSKYVLIFFFLFCIEKTIS